MTRPIGTVFFAVLDINASAYLIEGANPRHEHEWEVWQDTKLPDGKILVPGVVSHCSHLVEHPTLVAQRIDRYVDVVGKDFNGKFIQVHGVVKDIEAGDRGNSVAFRRPTENGST